ncbi:MAG: S8 family peptidase, partial [Nitriliruptoraceae bacterium]
MGHDQPVSAAGRWLRPQAVLLVGIAAAVLLGLLPGGPHAAAAPERVRVVVELGVAEGPVEVAPSGSRADIDPSPADPGQAQVSARLERAAAAEVSRERVGVRVAARLASDLAGAAQVAHRLDALPYLIVDVAADRLPDLAALPEVAGVSEDEVLRPLLADSVPLVGVTGTPGTTEEPVTVAGQPLTGAGTTVAVIDTGVRATHELLVDRLVGEACFVSGNGTCPNGEDEQIGEGSAAALDTEDDLVGHGTHVSGIAVGSRVEGGQVPQGVAPEAGLLAIQVFQPGERGPASNRSDLLRALDWLITEREEGRLGSLVAINLSLGTEDVASCPTEGGWADIDTAAARLNDLDVLTIAAAGNDGATGAMGLPACLPNVISVAATRPDDPTAIASSSNVSAETDLAAPGVGITSASSLEDDSYVARSGSSMAAPHVA